MSEPQINNEGAFIHAVGINPGVVKAGSVSIVFENQQPFVVCTLTLPVDWPTLAAAIAAGNNGVMPMAEIEPKEPEDHKPPVRARKAPAKKATK